MTDFGPLIANPKSFLLGAAAQFGIFGSLSSELSGMGFNDKAAAAISIIGGADGPTSIFLAGKLWSDRSDGTDCRSSIFLHGSGSDYPAADHETPDHRRGERRSSMEQLRPVSKLEKILFPVVVTYRCLHDSAYHCSAGWYADAW